MLKKLMIVMAMAAALMAGNALASGTAATITPEKALEKLMDGNRHYVKGDLDNLDKMSEAKNRTLVAAGQHPYAILGAKGVLEHFSIRMSDDVVRGIIASGIANAENAVSFFRHHGVLDIDHVRESDRNLGKLEHEQKRFQLLEGAYFTSGIYRSLVHYLLPT
jgi:hypothetical protein